jgi:hypothetical protein
MEGVFLAAAGVLRSIRAAPAKFKINLSEGIGTQIQTQLNVSTFFDPEGSVFVLHPPLFNLTSARPTSEHARTRTGPMVLNMSFDKQRASHFA